MSVESTTATKIRVDASNWLGELPHNWNYIGYDEINYTYVPEGQELLAVHRAAREALLCAGASSALHWQWSWLL